MIIPNIEFTLPDKTITVLAQFNKISGAFTGILEDSNHTFLNRDYYDYKKVRMNPATQEIVGTYDNFKVVDKSSQLPELFELQFDNAAEGKIDKEYPIYRRLEILEALIGKLAEAANINDQEYTEMVSYIAEVKRVNEIYKESIANDPRYRYITREMQQQQFDDQLEGGLHEFIGPRENTPQLPIT